jgi:hypothetical protein
MTPTTERTTPALLSRLAVGVAFGLALVKGLSPFMEPDVWWHLRTGDRLRESFHLVAPDPSAGFAARDYVATQWLPDMVASAAYSLAGVAGVLWLRCAFIIALVAVTYVACRRYAGRLPSALVAALTMLASGGGLNPRPQLVSFVLFAVVVHAWCGMAADRRPRWWLVPLFWVWGCSHGLWTFGLAFGVVVLVVLALEPVTRPNRAELTRLSLLLLACLGVLAVTPMGPRLLATPFAVAGNASLVAEEWRATPLNNVFAWAALAEVLVCVVLWAFRPARRPWWQLGVLAFAAGCVLWMWRLVPLGALAAAPLAAGAIQEWLSGRREAWGRVERAALLGLTAALVVVALPLAGLVADGASRYPERLDTIDRALGELPSGSAVMADFGVSGWLLWKHPELSPVCDLRGEIYSTDHLLAYRDALEARPGWSDFVAGTGSRVALLDRDSALADGLAHRDGWTVVARSKSFVLLEDSKP